MTQWVENGIAPPPSTVISFTPGNLTFPETADQRKGIQPTVNPIVDEVDDSMVYFAGVAESPIGNIIMYEWDFESDNNYDCVVTASSSTCPGIGPLTPGPSVNLLAEHSYSPSSGKYVATVRVTDDGSPAADDSETITLTVNETVRR